MSGLPFFGFVFSSLGFSCRRRVCSPFFLKDTDQVVTGHTPTLAPCWSCSFSLFCPRRMYVIAHFGRASFLFWCFLRVPFWALGILEFFNSLGTSWGLSSLAPLRPLSRTRGGKGVCVESLLSFLFFPFCRVCGCTH